MPSPRHPMSSLRFLAGVALLLLGGGRDRVLSAAETDMAARLECMARQARIVNAVLQFAREHDGRLPEPTQWREAIGPYGVGKEALDCPARPDTDPAAGRTDYGYGWWLAGRTLADFANPALIPVLADSDTPVLGNSMGKRRHGGGAVVAFLDGHVSWLTNGCPQCYANDFEDPAAFSAVAGLQAGPMTTWAVFSGDARIANFHDVLTLNQKEMRAAIATGTSGNHVLQLTIPAGMSTTYAVLPLLPGLRALPVRRCHFLVDMLIPDISTCMSGVRLYHAPLVPLTEVTLNGHNGLTLGPGHYVPIKGKHSFDAAELTPGKVLRVGYATELSTTQPSTEPFHLSLLPSADAPPAKSGAFIIPADQGSCAVSPEATRLLGLTLGAMPAFGTRQVESEVKVSFDRVYFTWE